MTTMKNGTLCTLAALASLTDAAASQTIEACKKLPSQTERRACLDKLRTPAPPPKGPPEGKPDGALAKMQSAVAAKLKDPESAQFSDIKRAMRKSARDEKIDTICGKVNAKNSYGTFSGAKPFVYFVKSGDVRLVDGKDAEAMLADMIYKNICVDASR
jgi:hypothetical protein